MTHARPLLLALAVFSGGVGCTNPEDAALKAAITYGAPFLGVAEDTTGTCESKLKVAEELYKMEKDRHTEIKGLVDKVKGDEKFKAKLKSEVDRFQNSPVAKSYLEKCPKEAEKLAQIVADTADAIGVTDLVPAWPPKK
ncbi:MAG: hypothetical protein JNL21_38060 [Myxococcales bacterium]|nr:hypothetical protein [Myxococcales bacterium]